VLREGMGVMAEQEALTVLQRAAARARQLGDVYEAELYEAAHEDHDGQPCWHKPCAAETRARKLLAQHDPGEAVQSDGE